MDLCAGTLTAYAQDDVSERAARALKAANIKQCLAIEVPAFVGFYRAGADYCGVDDFELQISLPNGHTRRESVHVTVTKSSSVGEGIWYRGGVEALAVEIFRRLEFPIVRIFRAHAIRAADVSTRIEWAIHCWVGAARKTATQIRFGDPTQREKLLLCRRASWWRRFTLRSRQYHGLCVRVATAALGRPSKSLF
jgi:hypothetical protein